MESQNTQNNIGKTKPPSPTGNPANLVSTFNDCIGKLEEQKEQLGKMQQHLSTTIRSETRVNETRVNDTPSSDSTPTSKTEDAKAKTPQSGILGAVGNLIGAMQERINHTLSNIGDVASELFNKFKITVPSDGSTTASPSAGNGSASTSSTDSALGAPVISLPQAAKSPFGTTLEQLPSAKITDLDQLTKLGFSPGSIKIHNLFLQGNDANCAVEDLRMIAKSLGGKDVTVQEMRALMGDSPDEQTGSSFGNVEKGAKALGLKATGVSFDGAIAALKNGQVVVGGFNNGKHAAVLGGISNDGQHVLVFDSLSRTPYVVSVNDLRNVMSGQGDGSSTKGIAIA